MTRFSRTRRLLRRDGRLTMPAKGIAGLVALGLLGSAFAGGARYGAQRVLDRDAWADGRLLSTAIDSVRANALDSLPSDELIRRAVSGMLRELHDPYAALLRPDGYRTYRGSLLGESQGLGLSLRLQGALLSVRAVAEGSPAAAAGVRRGDRIVSWNGVAVSEWRTGTANDTAHAPPELTQLVVQRVPSGDSIRVAMRRATWHLPAVTSSGLLTDSVGYVRVAAISQHAAQELEHAVEALERRGARSLVLDLRGNGGGLFEEGIKAAALFLPSHAVVASLAGRGGAAPQVYRAEHSRWPAMPLTVLVDAGTASSAEVIAVALREHNRALLVGAPTYGKGVVQRVVRLSDELSLRLTTARWLTPSGRSLQRRQGTGRLATGGLLPDVLLDDPTWRDPSAVPREWSPSAVLRAVAIADSVAIHAHTTGWDVSDVSALEAKLRSRMAPEIPQDFASPLSRVQWIGVLTRLATARVLEMANLDESLLRYAMREDAALRAGLDVVAPGHSAVTVVPTELPLTAVAARVRAR